jgi:sugar O-acyltransferase (sialic acid O-acetyltransferase NeuD family)
MTKGNLIIGAGGHGKVIADIMQRQGMNILGFLDDNVAIIGQQILNLPVLDTIAMWRNFAPDGLVMGIGDNSMRYTLVRQIEQDIAAHWIIPIHPTATIAASVQIGDGTVIMAGVIINPDTILGKHTIINTAATVDHDCVVGDFVHIAPGTHLAGDVHVGNGSLLGIGCSVIPGCKIGENVIVGAGAVVIGDIPSGVVAKGIPAHWET